MTRHDQELLDRQLRHLHIPQRHDGVLMLAMTALFLAGLFLGNWHATATEATSSQIQGSAVVALNGTTAAPTLLR
jgi:hypothetical protein